MEDLEFRTIEVALSLKKSTEEVSNGLRRLHHMGFLRRKRVNRRCLSKNGKLCNKGREYLYSISKQGERYLNWMITKKPIEDITHVELITKVLNYLPDDLKQELYTQSLMKSISSYNGPSRSFDIIVNRITPFVILYSENQKLASENSGLKTENMIQQLNNAFYMGFILGLNERIKELELQRAESEKMILDNISPLIKVIISRNRIINSYRNKNEIMLLFLHELLPKEKFSAFYQIVSELEQKELTDKTQEL